MIDAGVGLLLQILLGYLFAWLRPKPFAVDAALKVLNAFVFCVAIPSLMFKVGSRARGSGNVALCRVLMLTSTRAPSL